jgi:hypothetical protein
MISRERCNWLLLASFGNKELVDQWWHSPNAAFNHNKPDHVWTQDPQSVIDYVLRATNPGGDYY